MLKNITTTLYLPGLWALLRHGGDEIWAKMPSLQRLLKRSDKQSNNPLESELQLLKELGWQGDGNGDVPVAALERLGLGRDGEGFCFRADPVNLQEDQNYLMMSYPSVLKLDQQEAEALAESINEHFAEDGWHLDIVDPQRWYLNLDKDPGIQTTPLWRAVGRDIFGLMPAGDNSRQWHAWLMELQMLLHNHAVNQARIEQGLPAVSGLWVWGGGKLPVLGSDQFLIYGDTPFMQGVSLQSHIKLNEINENLSVIFDNASAEKKHLVMLEYARTALLSGDMDNGRQALLELEQEVFLPLLNLLQLKKITRLNIIDTPGRIVNVSSSGIRKWWRRNKLMPV